jgi:hypothetical protein
VIQLASWWVISIRAVFLPSSFGPYCNIIVLRRWVIFGRIAEFHLLTLQPFLSLAQHFHFFHVARFLCVCMRACTQVEIGLLYSTMYTKYSFLDDLLFISLFWKLSVDLPFSLFCPFGLSLGCIPHNTRFKVMTCHFFP